MTKPFEEVQLYNRIGWQYKSEVERKCSDFQKTDNLRTQIGNISRLMYNSRRFGLFIRGTFGNGKTTAAKAIKNTINKLVSEHYFGDGEIYPWEWMEMVNAREMINMYVKENDKFLDLKKQNWLIIDDLGLDPSEINVYGTKFYPFLELIDYRYDRHLPTILVSNLKKEELMAHYADERFADRFNEMFNSTTFRDNSFRK